MKSSSPYYIDPVVHNLVRLRELSLHDQGVFLLKRLALSFRVGETFSKDDLFETRARAGKKTRSKVYWPDPNGLAAGFPWYELLFVRNDLCHRVWAEIVHAGYVAEAPPGSGWYRITEEGRVVINGRDDRAFLF
jgi:hypothetical protein